MHPTNTGRPPTACTIAICRWVQHGHENCSTAKACTIMQTPLIHVAIHAVTSTMQCVSNLRLRLRAIAPRVVSRCPTAVVQKAKNAYAHSYSKPLHMTHCFHVWTDTKKSHTLTKGLHLHAPQLEDMAHSVFSTTVRGIRLAGFWDPCSP